MWLFPIRLPILVQKLSCSEKSRKSCKKLPALCDGQILEKRQSLQRLRRSNGCLSHKPLVAVVAVVAVVVAVEAEVGRLLVGAVAAVPATQR